MKTLIIILCLSLPIAAHCQEKQYAVIESVGPCRFNVPSYNIEQFPSINEVNDYIKSKYYKVHTIKPLRPNAIRVFKMEEIEIKVRDGYREPGAFKKIIYVEEGR